MKKLIVFLFFVSFSTVLLSQNKPAYKLYNAKGAKVSYKKMLKKMSKADIVLFGEHHNNPIVHWLQYETTVGLSEDRALMLGAEMIEADNQKQLNQYLADEIDQKAFDTVARLWNNHSTDYKPIVDFAKENNLKFVAANIPRRYASEVFRGGFEALEKLSNEEKSWIAPLPIKYDATLPGYVKMKEMMGGHGGDNLPKAQAIKDATMAHFILKNRKENNLFIHYNGSYHSDDYEGINWYLKQAQPTIKIITVSVVEQENLKKLEKENKLKADFIIVVPPTMTKTY
ncbi:MAG: ChaN family lipoprotein [Lutibacter sp.]|uniref:ChaN family lipoprotein n=1 Tax=Lutibacter sp. TaxID=1925666 RepID=UPI001805B808|nr:ChaN family lipoprotein [Lutibacter sp.]MBT8317244.1 ChaN family lipoprotein [Lutibacter sp.]NNJ58104.1 ChaN family lipoprotein [Lutibacter sp.]